MPTEYSGQHDPIQIHQHDQSSPVRLGRTASRSGLLALVLCLTAFATAPLLLFIPYIGFVPALFAGSGIVIASLGLRGSDHGTGTAVTGLIASVVVFALLAGITTLWNIVVADPAIREYDELNEVIDYVKTLIFGP